MHRKLRTTGLNCLLLKVFVSSLQSPSQCFIILMDLFTSMSSALSPVSQFF